MPRKTDPPGLEPLDSAIIGRCTNAEREYVGHMAAMWEMSVSEYVRFAVLRYTQTVLERAENMTMADMVLAESKHVTRPYRADAE